MRDIWDGVSPNFGRKSSAPGRKYKKAESFGFMSGAQEILQGLLRCRRIFRNQDESEPVPKYPRIFRNHSDLSRT